MSELQPIVIGGKPGTVGYFDDRFALTTPDQARLAKVVFDDGSTAFFIVKPTQRMLAGFDEGQPRDEHGRWIDEGGTDVGITSSRPGRESRDVFEQMREFDADLKKIPTVTDVDVKPGVGAWQGGKEPTWIVHYHGNGEATKLLAQTGKRFDQDAVLVMRHAGSGADSVVSDLRFDKTPTARQRDAIGRLAVANGIGGWSWMKSGGKTVLRMAAVPQWGAKPDAHRKTTQAMSRALRKHGLSNTVRHSAVKVEIMERAGDHSYDAVIQGNAA